MADGWVAIAEQDLAVASWQNQLQISSSLTNLAGATTSSATAPAVTKASTPAKVDPLASYKKTLTDAQAVQTAAAASVT